MKLRYKTDHISIREFEPVKLPGITILTGLNGSGKTHLLQSINSGASEIEGVSPADIQYFNYTDFKVAAQQPQNGQQIQQAKDAAWNVARGFQKPATAIYEQTIGPVESSIVPAALEHLWDVAGNSSVAEQAIASYVERIQSEVFSSPNFKGKPHSSSIEKAVRQVGVPLHEIDREQFMDHFVPYGGHGSNYLATGIGTIFTAYVVDRFIRVHDQWQSTGAKQSIDELTAEFAERFPPPWDLMNDILRSIHEASGGSVFNFALTTPPDRGATMSGWQTYSFTPHLVDVEDGGPRAFENLSSGETVLLALAVSIYEAQQSYRLPDVLLLDEVDATLHPSMINALLTTLREVFVSRGTNVILATHAPTTVALADDLEIHLITKGKDATKVERVERADALSVLTEGYATLEDGLKFVGDLSEARLFIVSEGRNHTYLERACEIAGLEDVRFLRGIEAKSGTGQLGVIQSFLGVIDHVAPVLFVYDSDYKKDKPDDTKNTFSFTFAANSDNSLAERGIENLFDEALFTDDYVVTTQRPLRKTERKFDGGRKTDFETHVLGRQLDDDFLRFKPFTDRAQEILGAEELVQNRRTRCDG